MTQRKLNDYATDLDHDPETEDVNSGNDESESNINHLLSGLQANDPLAFLAAVGTLRALIKSSEFGTPKMNWKKEGGNWIPVVRFETPVTRDQILDALTAQLTGSTDSVRYVMSSDSDNPTDKLSNLNATFFKELLSGIQPNSPDERALAAYATDAYVDHNEMVEFDVRERNTALTRLNVLEFGGPKAYLTSQRKFVNETTRSKLRKTLFELWDLADDASSHRTMHWSPTDASRGAYTGVDPTNLPSRTMHGANRLAIAGSRLYTVTPQTTDSATIGFVDLGDRYVFQYPIWTAPVTVPTIRTLLTHPDVACIDPNPESVPEIEMVLRAEIEVNNNYRNLGRGIPVDSNEML